MEEAEEQHPQDDHHHNKDHPTVVIVGGGIVGLVLALALRKHVGLTPTIYESAPQFADEVGAGMGMYPNGLRVIRDIDPALFKTLRSLGHPYVYRRWERANGSLVMDASEEVLNGGDSELSSFGIRRWKLQKALYEAVVDAGIPVHFGHKLVNIIQNVNSNNNNNAKTIVEFKNGARVSCDLLFGADGGKSAVRTLVVPDDEAPTLEYTGITCLMGISEKCSTHGISFPSSTKSRCHAVFFPTSDDEQCFQFHFPIPAEETNPGNWGQLSEQVGKDECCKLASILADDGWNPERYIQPLLHVTKAVRIGFCQLQPRLKRWVYGPSNRIVLVGDAAHPPVPYTGQGAQQGLEDAGTIALLMKNFCRRNDANPDNMDVFDWGNWNTVVKLYEKIRIPRAAEVGDMSSQFGNMQFRRATSEKYDVVQGEKIQRQVFFHETLPCLLPGATGNYRDNVAEACREVPTLLPIVKEEEEE